MQIELVHLGEDPVADQAVALDGGQRASLPSELEHGTRGNCRAREPRTPLFLGAEDFSDRAVQVASNRPRSKEDQPAGCSLACGTAFDTHESPGNGPPGIDLSKDLCVSSSHFGHEHLAETCLAVHLAKRTDLYPGLIHIEEKEGDSLSLWYVCVCAREEHAATGEVGCRIPDLLS